MMKRKSVIAVAAAAILAAGSANLANSAPAQDGGAFLASLAGNWSGSGTVKTSKTDPAGATHCQLNGTPTGKGISISGSCDGVAKGAHLAVVLSWNAGLGEIFGSFQGAAETGTASLNGKVVGSSLQMQVTSANGTTSRMTLTKSGDKRVSLTVSGKDTKSGKTETYVSIGLARS